MPTLTPSSLNRDTIKAHEFASKYGSGNTCSQSKVAAESIDGDAVRTAIIISQPYLSLC